jgi:hypothetical protein
MKFKNLSYLKASCRIKTGLGEVTEISSDVNGKLLPSQDDLLTDQYF